MRQRKIGVGILVGALLILALVGGGFVYRSLDSKPTMPEAIMSLETDEAIRVSMDPWITFTPTPPQP